MGLLLPSKSTAVISVGLGRAVGVDGGVVAASSLVIVPTTAPEVPIV
jgi:hypothetical protein